MLTRFANARHFDFGLRELEKCGQDQTIKIDLCQTVLVSQTYRVDQRHFDAVHFNSGTVVERIRH